LPENDRYTSLSVALLHDVGRFEQFVKYRTLNDRQSESHAQISIDELKSHRVLDHLTVEEIEIIFKAIDAHSRKTIPENLDQRSVLFSKLIRDADKLDIWKVLIEADQGTTTALNAIVFSDLPDNEEYNPKALKAISSGEMFDLAEIRSRNDFRLLAMAWVFDLNFSASFHLVLERGYIDMLAERLPEHENIKKAVLTVNNYLARHKNRQDLQD